MEERYIQETQNWLRTFVVGMGLCPFARHPFEQGIIHYSISEAQTKKALLEELWLELERLVQHPLEEIETSLLIIPDLLKDFGEYWEFLELAEELLVMGNWEGVFQIASFHPDYQFENTNMADAENYTNKSPYPMLHLLREDRLTEVLEFYPDPAQIPVRNIQAMKAKGKDVLEKMRNDCFIDAS